MGHNHNHGTTENFKTAFFLNFGFAILELFGGMATNSVAILSDALHDLGDSISLGLAWFMEGYSGKASDENYSYGYGRFSLLAALINSLILVLGSFIILSEAVPRILNPEHTNAGGMIGFALLGIVVNGAAVLKMGSQNSINARVVRLHLLEDVFGWMAVLVGGVILLFFDLPIIDPLLAVGLTLYILFNVYKNLQETISIFLQSKPKSVNLEAVNQKIRSCSMVLSNHDTHIWSLDGEHHVMTAHIVIDENSTKENISEIKRQCKIAIDEILHFSHITIEVEFPSENCSHDCTGLLENQSLAQPTSTV